MTTGTCSICGGRYVNCGNSADPFTGVACHDCDDRFVTPARMLGVSDPATLTLLTQFARHGRTLTLLTQHGRDLVPWTY